eukprot:evm.model.scf_1238.3 EVM.evm.TU.scf_1238.3   scf_1238:26007-36121(-)
MGDPAPAGQFFPPWEGPPPFVPPPEDAGLRQRITKLAEFAKRNGPNFVDLIINKQQENPEYGFLFGGEGADYYRWSLYCSLSGHPVDQPLAGAQYAPFPSQPSHPAAQFQPLQQQQQPLQQQQQPLQQPQQPLQQQQQPILQGSQNFYPTQVPAQRQPPGLEAGGAMGMEAGAGYGGVQQATHGSGVQSLGQGLGLPAEVATGFAQVLEALNGSKDSIKASQNWFMACSQFVDGMALMMARRVQALSDVTKQLHVIYLANDILFKSLSQRQPGVVDPVSRAFQPVIGTMLNVSFQQGGRTPEIRDRLTKILNFWAERAVYDQPQIVAFEQEGRYGMNDRMGMDAMRIESQGSEQQQPHQMPAIHVPDSGGAADAAPLPWQNPVQANAGLWHPPAGAPNPIVREHPLAATWGQPPVGQLDQGHLGVQEMWYGGAAQPGMDKGPMYQAPGAMPLGHLPPPSMGGQGAPGPGAFQEPPQHHMLPRRPGSPRSPVPVNPMSFPPGLIPQLVMDKNRDGSPYSPISPLDIDRAGLPPPPEKDAYLLSRLDKFYGELEEYRPGAICAEIEDRRDRRDRAPRDDGDRRGAKRKSGFDMVADPTTGMLPDGSYGGRSGPSSSMHAGLGANSRHSPRRDRDEDDVYESYRRMRSGVYHQTISRGAAHVPKGR